MHLEPCPSCRRHVKTTEPTCPFCTTPVPESLRLRAPPRVPLTRLGRRATFAFGIAVVAGCGGETTGRSNPDATPSDSESAPDGASPDATADQGAAGQDAGVTPVVDAAIDMGGPVPIYSAAPP